MSVVFDAASTADTTGAAATSFSNATNMTVGASANVLVVLIAWSSTAPTGISITWNGVALTQVSGAAHANGTAGNTDIWALVNPATGTKTLAGSWTGSRDFYVAALSYSGADSSSVANAFTNGNFAVSTSASISASDSTHTGNANVAIGAAAGTINSVTSGTQVFLDNTQTAKAVGFRLTGNGSNQNFTAGLAASVAWVISFAEIVQAPPFGNISNDYSNRWGRNDLTVPEQPYNQNLYQVVIPLPRNQYDYPRPFRVLKSPYDLSVSLNPNLFKNNVPISNLNDASKGWGRNDLPVPEQPYNQNLYSVTTVLQPRTPDIKKLVPFPQVTPQPQPYNPNLYTVVAQLPFNQTDFPKVFDLRQAPFSPDQALNINLFTNAFPLNQYDYLKSIRLPKAPFFPHEALNPNTFTNPYPFNQYDYLKSIRLPQAPVNPDQSLNINVFAVVPTPFIPIDWNKPFVPKLPPTIDQALNVNLFTNPVPVHNLDLFTPIRAKGFSDTSQAYNVNLYGVVVAQVPFNQVDWIKPFVRRPAPMQDQGFNQNIFTNSYPVQNVTGLVAGFGVADFPISQQPYNQNLYSIVSVQLQPRTPDIKKLVPFPQVPPQSQPYNQNLYSIVAQLPFNQTDFPKVFAIRQAPVNPDQALNINLFTNQYPFFNVFGLSTKVTGLIPPPQPYNQNIYTVVVTVLPFNTYDYPRATRLPRVPYDLSVQTNPNLFANLYPFNQYDWRKAFRTPQAPIERSVQVNPNLSNNAVPFSQFEYPRPVRVRINYPIPTPYNQNLYSVTVTTTLHVVKFIGNVGSMLVR